MQCSYRKKMIEVALPLEAINKAAAREKSIRHGHPSTLHLWWARRPLAACRAVLFASLVDDPDSDPEYRKPNGNVDEEKAAAKRAELFNLIEELVQWENSNNPTVINKARAEIARCVASRKIELGELDKATIIFGKAKGTKHKAGPVSNEGVTAYEVLLMRTRPEVVNDFLVEYAPPVLDPFCGGGSIPLEAQRLGLRAHGSDLNPIPVLITKALIEIPPKFANQAPVNPEARKQGKLAQTWTGAQGLAEDVRYYGKWMREEAERRIGHLYPKVKVTAQMLKDRPDLKPYVGAELTVIAWLWARTVASPNPAVGGVHVPLVRSFWLGSKRGKEAYVEPRVNQGTSSYQFLVRIGKPSNGFDPSNGTVGRAGRDRCLVSGSPLTRQYIRREAMAGRMAARLMAIVAEGDGGRAYLPPLEEQEKLAAMVPIPDGIPETEIVGDLRYLTPVTYGMVKHRQLFTPRQLSILSCFSNLVREATVVVREHAIEAGMSNMSESRNMAGDGVGSKAYGQAVATYLAFLVDQLANHQSTLCGWNSVNTQMRTVFARQALSMSWDYAESNPFCESSGSYQNLYERLVKGFAALPAERVGVVRQFNAMDGFNEPSDALVSTDPPYYDNIGYADLSDFFYIWLRASLGNIYPTLFTTLLTPKSQELTAMANRFNGSSSVAQRFFEEGLTQTFAGVRPIQSSEYPMSVYYAFKQSEIDEGEDGDSIEAAPASTGWETMLEGLAGTGFCVTGTWPMRTEKPGRSRDVGSNALASCIVLTCRPRPADASVVTRREFLNIINRELPNALKHLQRGSIAPVDLAQAAIGPGMAVFTRYAKVMESSGKPMSVRTALGLINQALDEVLAEQEGEFDADTRWALAWFEQFGMEEGQFGVAETLSRAKNTAINGLVEAGVIKARAGKVRLLKRDELPADWNPATDKRLTIWEVTQHLIRALDQQGESGAADLLRKLGGTGEIARDLAYRLYTMCERKKWADEALAYNGLVIAWPELTRLAMSAPKGKPGTQSELFA